MPYTLAVYIMLGGVWVAGGDGWRDVDYPTKEECIEQASFAADVAITATNAPWMIFECSKKKQEIDDIQRNSAN
jgi:hypothetical protein